MESSKRRVAAAEQGQGQLSLRLQDMDELGQGSELFHTRDSRRSSTSSLGSVTTNIRNLEHILLAAQQQQLRQLRRLQQLKKQAEITAAQQAAIEAKERAEAARKAKRQAELAEEAARRSHQAAVAEEKRRAVHEAAERHREEVRQKLEAKLARIKPRFDETLIEYERRLSAAKSAARMQRTLQRKEQVLEERRQAILAAEAAAEMRMQQKEELRLLQDAIKREEDYLAEERRREIQARAEADEEAKCAYYLAKQEERETRLQQRQQQAELLRMLRAEEAQARFDYIRSRAAEVSEQDDVRREQLARRLEAKMERADALAEERAALTNYMRNTLITNELKFKELMDRAKVRGSLDLPPELLEVMQQLQQGAGRPPSPTLSRSSSLHRSLPTSKARSLNGTPRREPGRRSSQSAASGSQLQRQQEAALQRILEEEILKEMDREAALREAAEPEDRKRLIKQFAFERDAAKSRILEIGNQLLPESARQSQA